MKIARWLLPIATLAIVLLVTWWDFGGERAGPGPLHPAHAGVPAMANGSNCEACHVPGAGIDAMKCTACHTAIGEQLAALRGLHGGMPATRARRCESCHSEHHDQAVALIAPHAFAQVGVAKPDEYDHQHVAFTLVGAHAQLSCERCHAHANDVAPPQKGRFLGLSQQCATCHDDVHRGVFGADCNSCHGQAKPWREAPGLPHQAFPLVDAHAKVACASCHAAAGSHSVAALRQHPEPARTCIECHANPHDATAAQPSLLNIALQLALRATPRNTLRLNGAEDCRRCHDTSTWHPPTTTPERHAEFGFVLRGAHATAQCATCHGNAQQQPRWTGAAPKLAACAACHDHPHHPELLLASATAGQQPRSDCAGCHGDADENFRKGTMPTELHAATGFPLLPPHAEVACASCHAGADRAERFPGRAAADCRVCHLDAHAGQFDDAPGHAQCTECHLRTAFRPPQFGVVAHANTFALTGAHDAVGCNECHREVHDGVRRFRGVARDCAGCHADVHRGAFDRAGLPKAVGGQSGCARCHDTSRFAPVSTAFDHDLWTTYQLVGAHTTVDCAQCHTTPRNAAGAGHRLGTVPGQRCADCHSDPHAGQFAENAKTDCRRCHDATSFATAHFDHQKSAFPLDAVHRDVGCAKCHKSYETAGGNIVRYKPLGTSCGDCHKLGTPGGRR